MKSVAAESQEGSRIHWVKSYPSLPTLGYIQVVYGVLFLVLLMHCNTLHEHPNLLCNMCRVMYTKYHIRHRGPFVPRLNVFEGRRKARELFVQSLAGDRVGGSEQGWVGGDFELRRDVVYF